MWGLTIPCTGSSTPFTFDGSVFPGTHEVRVRGGLSNLPRESYQVLTSFGLQADQTGIGLDVVTRSVAGVVTMNGQQPTSNCSSSDRASVRFHEPTQGYDLTFAVPCTGGSSPFAFTGSVFPGTYEVWVRGGLWSLPRESFLVIGNLAVP